MTIIETDKIKDLLASDLTGYRVSKLVDIRQQNYDKYKNGTLKIENMTIKVASQLMKVIEMEGNAMGTLKKEVKSMQLNFSHAASDGSIDKSDLEFQSLIDEKTVLIRNAEIHLNIDFEKGSDDQSPEFRLIEEYWDDPKNIVKAIDEADEEDIEEVE